MLFAKQLLPIDMLVNERLLILQAAKQLSPKIVAEDKQDISDKLLHCINIDPVKTEC